MFRSRILLAASALLPLLAEPALAGHHGFGGYHGHGGPGFVPVGPPIRCGHGYRGRSPGLVLASPFYASPFFASPATTAGFWPIPAIAMVMPNMPAANFAVPPPPRMPANAFVDRRPVQAIAQRRPAIERPAVATQRVTFGQRLFRAGNLTRAVTRFQQAALANPKSAAPYVGLAQVALSRGRYTEAADALRKAQSAQPGWLTNAPDIEAMYGEPADFAKQVAKLESHLQLHPNDRDAWLVLGAQYYLSGRTRQAADVFTRLNDRPADDTLSAFLEASGANREQARE